MLLKEIAYRIAKIESYTVKWAKITLETVKMISDSMISLVVTWYRYSILVTYVDELIKDQWREIDERFSESILWHIMGHAIMRAFAPDWGEYGAVQLRVWRGLQKRA